MNKYIALDVETGGVGLETSLLTSYFSILNEKFEKIGDLYLRIKPDDGLYRIESQALAINGINLIEHDKIAVSKKDAGKLLYDFLYMYKGVEPLIPIGHGTRWDIVRVNEQLLHNKAWDQFVSHRVIDTGIIARYLQDVGWLPTDLSFSLNELAKFFSLKSREQKEHNAKEDVEITVEVYKSLINLARYGR